MGGLAADITYSRAAFTQTGVTAARQLSSQAVTVAEVTLAKGNVGTTIGFFTAKNVDATDNITLRSKTADSASNFAVLKPGMSCQLHSGQTNIYAVASANTPILEYAMFPD